MILRCALLNTEMLSMNKAKVALGVEADAWGPLEE